MRSTQSGLFILAIFCLSQIVAADEQLGARRVKRQSEDARINGRRPAVSSNSADAPMAMSMASSSSMASSGAGAAPSRFELGDEGEETGATKKVRQKPTSTSKAPPSDEDQIDDQEDESKPIVGKPPKAKRPRRPPPNRGTQQQQATGKAKNSRNDEHDDYESSNEDCDDYEGSSAGHYDYAFTRPMRQFGQLIGDVFDQMHGMASGDYDSYADGPNVAVASSSFDGGDSRMSSIVRRNGRTRGVVSETRNGRTKVKRIGDETDLDADDEE